MRSFFFPHYLRFFPSSISIFSAEMEGFNFLDLNHVNMEKVINKVDSFFLVLINRISR